MSEHAFNQVPVWRLMQVSFVYVQLVIHRHRGIVEVRMRAFLCLLGLFGRCRAWHRHCNPTGSGMDLHRVDEECDGKPSWRSAEVIPSERLQSRPQTSDPAHPQLSCGETKILARSGTLELPMVQPAPAGGPVTLSSCSQISALLCTSFAQGSLSCVPEMFMQQAPCTDLGVQQGDLLLGVCDHRHLLEAHR